MKKRQRTVARLRFEQLESRAMLAANVLIVSNALGTGGDDVALRDAIVAGGNTVDSDSGAFAAAPPSAAQLADVDVIVVSRFTTSGDYNGTGEAAAWNALNKPLILMAPHIARSTHWGYFNSTAITADAPAPTNFDAFPNASHPFVAGFTTEYAPAGVTIDYLSSTAVPATATVVASLSAPIIVDIPAGATSFASGNPAFGARRVFYGMPDYNDQPTADYADVVSSNANGILMRMIDVLANKPLEAEAATLSGPTVQTANAGFTGTGYADFGTAPGEYIQWNVVVPVAGNYNLAIRYANGSAANRPLQLSVNAAVDQAALAFDPTGAWTTWNEVVEVVALSAGANALRLTMNGAQGPNVDSARLTYAAGLVLPPDAAPSDLAADVATSTQINLFWSDNATNESEYQIERRLAAGGSFQVIATAPANSTSFSNNGLTPSTQYVYRVRAANSAGFSDYSSEANAITLPAGDTTPAVTSVTPGPGAANVFLDRDVVATVFVPNGGINAATMNSSTVKIYPTGNPGSPVPAAVNTSGGGDIIVARPTSNLLPNTSYTFEVTSGVKDITGVSFAPFTSTFTTGTQVSPVDASIQFERVALPTVDPGQYSCVTIGPDGKLYAARVNGDIVRWEILANGTLGTQESLSSFRDHNNGENRLLIGLDFDPSSTANNLILWATHSQYAFDQVGDFNGTLTRLQGANLENVHDAVIHLPRSYRDHATNQIDFGPDGALYFLQGSNSGMGAPDAGWGNRPEHLLTAAVLRFDPAMWDATVNGPLDVHTEDADPYDPFALNAPLTIFASGIRNAYDLVWHSNGELYVPTNGSAGGANAPASPAIPPGGLLPRIDAEINGPYTGPAVPGVTPGTQSDYLFRVEQGGYYGHPNPSRNEFVLNGGNPTSGVDPAQVTQYPVGTLPDRNYRGFAYDFGTNRSPNGVIEYQWGGFGGALVGKLLVARFSTGDDLIVLEPGPNGDIVGANDAIASFDGFIDPLDLVENPTNGHLYVSQYIWGGGGEATIFLLRPVEPNLIVDADPIILDEIRGGDPSEPRVVTVENTGTGNLWLTDVVITGASSSQFSFAAPINMPVIVAPGDSYDINIVFNPGVSTPLGPHLATLHVQTNDIDQPSFDVDLGGLATNGWEGGNEPSWQWINDVFRIPVDVGDNNDASAPIDGLVLPNGNNIQRFVKAGPGNVTIEPLAVYSGHTGAQPAGIVGWYEAPATLHELFQFGSGDDGQHQELLPTIAAGTASFDPGAADFGLYSQWPTFPGRTVFSENVLNTFDLPKTQKHLVFPLKDSSGAVVPNAYLVGIEEAANDDFQDLVYIIRNVAPVTGDFDENGQVDGNDFLVWQRGLGTTVGATRGQGNADFDGDVDAADLAVWRGQFGSTTSVVPAAEPAIALAVSASIDAVAEFSEAANVPFASRLDKAPATDLVDLLYARDSGFRPQARHGGYRAPSVEGRLATWSPALPSRPHASPSLTTGDAIDEASHDDEIDAVFAELDGCLGSRPLFQ